MSQPYLADFVPERFVEGSGAQYRQREAGRGGGGATEVHGRADSDAMQALAPPLVRRDAQPRHIRGRVHQLLDLLGHRQPRDQIRHAVLVRHGRVAEREEQVGGAIGVARELELALFEGLSLE